MNQISLSEREAGATRKGSEIQILENIPGKELDDITRLAAFFAKTPISMVCLVNGDGLQIASSFGDIVNLNAGILSFCNYTMEGGGLPFVVTNAAEDDRFKQNLQVTTDPFFCFYAGVALASADGSILGTLFVADKESHQRDEFHPDSLAALANLASKLLEKNQKIEQLQTRIKLLENFTTKAAHDIKSPLCSISMMTELFREQYAGQMDPDGIELLTTINDATVELAQSVDDILQRKKE